jgi:hypothetical protein
MPDTIKPKGSPNSRTDTGNMEIAPEELTKAGAVSLKGEVLTVKNEELAQLIHSKLSEASKLVPVSKAAADVDVSVSVKVK